MYKLLPFFLLSPLFVGLFIICQGTSHPSVQFQGSQSSPKLLSSNDSSPSKTPCSDRSEKGCPEDRRDTQKPRT